MRKKIFFIVALFVSILLTGCGKTEKLTCTNEKKYGTAVLKNETVIKFKNGYKSESKTTMEALFDSDSTAKSFADTYEEKMKEDAASEGINIISVKQDKNKVVVKIEETKKSIKENKTTKAEEKEQLENGGFKCE